MPSLSPQTNLKPRRACTATYQGRKKPIRCTKCDARFAAPCELREHDNLHTGNRPYPCPVCQKRYMRRATLWNHYRVHIEHYPFKCPLCPSKFKWKNCFGIHRRKHIRDDPSTASKFDQVMEKLNETNKEIMSMETFFANNNNDETNQNTAGDNEQKLEKKSIDLRRTCRVDSQRAQLLGRYLKSLMKSGELARQNEPEMQAITKARLETNKIIEEEHRRSLSTGGLLSASNNPNLTFPVRRRTKIEPINDDEEKNNVSDSAQSQRAKMDDRAEEENGLEKEEEEAGETKFYQKDVVRRVPLAVTRSEMDDMLKLHGENRSCFLFRSFTPKSEPIFCVSLPTKCQPFDASQLPSDESDYDDNQENCLLVNGHDFSPEVKKPIVKVRAVIIMDDRNVEQEADEEPVVVLS